ncbi:hypothetical protein AXF23_05335 [Prevotella sp. oral taxon 313]|uniref:hypothetical protein n=1 Tax=Prevotella sp. oral taxon 313 TaxID=652722 RepID=UPI000D1EA440|nr:hypothetical protein [Prevotella sp. oral taxon 313]PTL30571.1 hypothetical protein AXF23_05335 [Prevotella sp. oral taxon 313]
MTETYDDIIHLPHHVSKRHPQMSLYNRAAQFAPFAALTGYEEAIIETARLTAPKVDMMEDNQQLLDRKLALLSHSLIEQPTVSITYFQPDKKKSGGQYLTVTGVIKCIRDSERVIRMADGKRVSIDTIINIDGDIFSSEEYPSPDDELF